LTRACEQAFQAWDDWVSLLNCLCFLGGGSAVYSFPQILYPSPSIFLLTRCCKGPSCTSMSGAEAQGTVSPAHPWEILRAVKCLLHRAVPVTIPLGLVCFYLNVSRDLLQVTQEVHYSVGRSWNPAGRQHLESSDWTTSGNRVWLSSQGLMWL
jgi:hypothetical protein